MGDAIDAIKIRLISRITLSNDANLIALLDKILNKGKLLHEDWLLLSLAVPVQEKTDLDDLIQVQNYRGPNRQRFDQAVQRMNIQEPIEDLLAQLTK